MSEQEPTRQNYKNLKLQAERRGIVEVPPSSDHYKKLAIEPLEVILANGYGFLKGNAIKYLMREEHKGGVDDLKKAIWYIERIIEERERGAFDS